IGSTVTISNTTDDTNKRIWFEIVTKELATRVDDVSFSPRHDGVVLDDPIVYWVVELQPGAQRTLVWTTPLPPAGEPTSKYLKRAVGLHRIAVENPTNQGVITFATASLERETGAEAVDPTETVETP